MAVKFQGGKAVPASQGLLPEVKQIQVARAELERRMLALSNKAANDRELSSAMKKAASLCSQAGEVITRYMMTP